MDKWKKYSKGVYEYKDEDGNTFEYQLKFKDVPLIIDIEERIKKIFFEEKEFDPNDWRDIIKFMKDVFMRANKDIDEEIIENFIMKNFYKILPEVINSENLGFTLDKKNVKAIERAKQLRKRMKNENKSSGKSKKAKKE